MFDPVLFAALMSSTAAFTPLSLFAAGEQGAWYDPSDFLPNWRLNLLTRSNEFSVSPWGNAGGYSVAQGVSPPFGSDNAWTITELANTAFHGVFQSASAAVTGTNHTFSCYMKAGERTWARLSYDGGGAKVAWFDLSNGTVGTVNAGLTAAISSAVSGWYRCSISFTGAGSGSVAAGPATGDNGSEAYLGNGTSRVYIFGADLRLTSNASVSPTYQKITDGVADYLTYQSQPVMFQDSAGTTPVTAVEQPVGLLLDKSKGGVGSNGGYRYNLLTQTDDLNDSGYAAFQVTKAVGGVVGPLGRNGTTLREVAVTNLHIIDGTPTFSVTSGTTYTASIYVKPVGRTRVTLNASSTWNSGIPNAYYDLVGAGSVDNVGSGVTATITAVTGGWYLLTYSVVANTTSALAKVYLSLVSTGTTTNYAGDITKGVDVFGYQVNTGASALSYQRVNADWPSAIPGNHASQSTAASRPVLSARVNLLTYSEQFDNAIWIKSNASITQNAGLAPDGTTTADLLYPATSGTNRRALQFLTTSAGANHTGSICVKASGKSWVSMAPIAANSGADEVYFDVTNGTVGTTGANVQSPTITSLGNGWFRISARANQSATTAFLINVCDANSSNSVTANGTDGVLIWGADVRVTNVGVNLPAYQRVAAATDYDTNGFPLYLKFDGVDDSLATGTIDPGAVDKAQVFAGYRRLSDAGPQILLETSSTLAFNNGAFGWVVPDSATNRASYNLRGTAITGRIDSLTAAAPNSLVAAALYDLSQSTSATEVLVRLNGASASTTQGGAADAGTSNFLAYPLYIGRRGGSSLPFNGNLYSMILRFSAANLSDAQIASTETWVNGKTGAY